MMWPVTSVMDALAGRRLIVEFPSGLAGWMGACEVLLQEGLSAWAVPAGDDELLASALRTFGRRARIGVRGVRTPDQAAAASRLGAHFITATVAEPRLLEAAGETPIALGALTPNEVHYALGIGAASVQVVPADAFGMNYSRALVDLFPGVNLLASGRFERWQADMWLGAGAAAVCLAPALLFADADQASGVDLVALRSKARDLAAAS